MFDSSYSIFLLKRERLSKIISILSSRYYLLRRSTLSVFLLPHRQRLLFSTKTTRIMPFKLPTLPDVPGTDPSRAVLDSFKVAIAKRVADALPPLTVEQVYQGVDYGKKGVDFTIALPRFRLPDKVDVLAKTVIDQVRTKYLAPRDLAYDIPFQFSFLFPSLLDGAVA
jgi:hypothetical protein